MNIPAHSKGFFHQESCDLESFAQCSRAFIVSLQPLRMACSSGRVDKGLLAKGVGALNPLVFSSTSRERTMAVEPAFNLESDPCSICLDTMDAPLQTSW
jgi:hypothetical protein